MTRQPGEFVFVHTYDCPGVVLFATEPRDAAYCVLLVPKIGPLKVANVKHDDMTQSAAVGEEMQLVIGARLGARMRSPFGGID